MHQVLSVTIRAAVIAPLLLRPNAGVTQEVLEPPTTTTAAGKEAVLYIQIPKQITPNLTEAIAAVGQSTTQELAANVSVIDVVQNTCGFLDPSYLSLVAKENGISIDQLFATSSDSRTIIFPACAKSPANDEVTVGRGDTIEKLLKQYGLPASRQTSQRLVKKSTAVDLRELSSSIISKGEGDLASPQWKKQLSDFYSTANAQTISVVNDLNDPGLIRAGEEIELPAVKPVWTTIALRSDTSAEQAKEIIDAAWQKDNQGVTTNPTTSLGFEFTSDAPGLVSPLAVTDSQQYCGPPRASRTYPFDVVSVMSMLALVGLSDQEASSIMTLDTGVDLSSVPRSLAPDRNRGRLRKLIINDPTVPSISSQYVPGYNLALWKNDAASAKGYEYRWHGLSVYNSAMGSRQLDPLRTLAGLPVKVVPVSLIKPQGSSFLIDVGAFQEAVEKAAKDDRIGTVNISFFTTGDLQPLRSAIAAAGKSVVITVAAGNDGASLDTSRSWPAIYGGVPSNASGGVVITVGAHDEAGKIAGFSRRAWKYVDLLAPGCNIPTYRMSASLGADGKEILKLTENFETGTSFAAPLVAFASGLLQAEGVSANGVKARLITSADVSSELDSSVYSRGRLNLAKALAVNFDLVEYIENGTKRLRVGKIQTSHKSLRICGQEYRPDQIAKLAIDRAGSIPKAHIWLKNIDNAVPEGMERVPLCALRDDDFASVGFRDKDADQTDTLEIAQIADFIPMQ